MQCADLMDFQELYNGLAKAVRHGAPADVRAWQRRIDEAWKKIRVEETEWTASGVGASHWLAP
jgi:hypothetical protein